MLIKEDRQYKEKVEQQDHGIRHLEIVRRKEKVIKNKKLTMEHAS